MVLFWMGEPGEAKKLPGQVKFFLREKRARQKKVWSSLFDGRRGQSKKCMVPMFLRGKGAMPSGHGQCFKGGRKTKEKGPSPNF